MRVPVAREGYPFIAAAAIPAAVLWGAAALRGGTPLWILATAVTAIALALTAFFRDPERDGPRGPELILSPADGRVVDIGVTEEDSYLHGEALRVSIFLSLLDVHVNRYPVSGDVTHRSYEPGRFEPAWRSSASQSNERASTGIQANSHAILVRQIAGLAAKRVVSYARLGDSVLQGERMGLIRFGSRVDVYLPRSATLSVSLGQRAKGGITVIARLPG
jgi:phosphatidylserine decarboxylase